MYTYRGRVTEARLEDSGRALITQLDPEVEGGLAGDDYMYVELKSWNEGGNHEALLPLVDKMIEITIRVVEK